jgi:2',3'-cyclic-nucleotide 2'-phosphodiesterase/3'-nucleotidase
MRQNEYMPGTGNASGGVIGRIAPSEVAGGYCGMLSLFMLAGGLLGAAPTDTVRLVLVATTDVHGYITDWDYLQNTPWPGGLTRAAAVVDSLRERYPGQVLVVDAGDVLQGSPMAALYGGAAQRDPHPVIDAMNTLAYDAATPGERDFAFGADRFRQAVAGATFPWVSANLRVVPEDTLALPGYVVVVRNGVKVAITGFTTPGAMVWQRSQLAGRFRVDRVEATIQPVLREARQDADLVIALVHSGLEGRSSYDTTGIGAEQVAVRLAAGALRPDLVVVGHSHQEIVDTVIGGVHFVQPRPQGRSVAVVHLALLAQGGHLVPVRIRAETVALEEIRPAPRLTRRLLEPHRAALGWVSRVVGESDRRLSLAAARVEDTPLIRFIHATQRRASGAELSAAPAFDLRAGFDQGEITMGELFRLYPEEATLRAVRVSGAQLRAYLEQTARYYFTDSTGRVAPNRFVPGANFDLLGGAMWTLDLSQPPGSRITRLEVRGKPVAPEDSFTLALSSQRQQGIGNFAALAGAPVVYDRGESIRGLLLAELARRRVLRAQDLAGSDWSLVPADYAQRARALFLREPAAAPEPEPAIPPRILPVPPSREEVARRDSVARAQERADAIANAAVAMLRLPATAGAGGSLGRLVADAYRNALRADLALAASAELTGPLPAGGLTTGAIEGAVTGQPLVAIQLSGADLSALLENLLADSVPCCALAGAIVEFDPGARAYSRVRRVRLSTGRSIDRKAVYTLAVSGALLSADSVFALGASDCREGRGCRTEGRLSRWTVTPAGRTSSAVLRDYLRRLPQPISPPDDRRLVPTR